MSSQLFYNPLISKRHLTRTTAQPGLEPGKRDPKSRVLPLTPPGKRAKE